MRKRLFLVLFWFVVAWPCLVVFNIPWLQYGAGVEFDYGTVQFIRGAFLTFITVFSAWFIGNKYLR